MSGARAGRRRLLGGEATPSEETPSQRTPCVAVQTLGCKVNQVEGEQVLCALLSGGFELGGIADADVVVINTCTVTGEADHKARKLIRHALTVNPTARVVVTGCLAALGGEALRGLGARVIVEPDATMVASRVHALEGMAECDDARPGARAGAGFHTRAMVKVQDGCDGFCSYCIVPYARGLPRSVSAADVVAECSALAEAGASEIVLTGINLGRYDDAGSDLSALVRRVAACGIPRLRLSSIEPVDLTEELLHVLASTPEICEHLHVPLQSGDDDVLRGMGRTYSVAEYAESIRRVRNAIPGVAISTDVLVGFPGEADEQAERTLDVCRELGFARLHVFRYSPRVGTVAATRTDQVEPGVLKARASRARALDSGLRAAFARSACGHEREVLVERIVLDSETSPAIAEGTTRDYLKVRFFVSATTVGERAVEPGSLANVKLEALGADGVVSGALVGAKTLGKQARKCEQRDAYTPPRRAWA